MLVAPGQDASVSNRAPGSEVTRAPRHRDGVVAGVLDLRHRHGRLRAIGEPVDALAGPQRDVGEVESLRRRIKAPARRRARNGGRGAREPRRRAGRPSRCRRPAAATDRRGASRAAYLPRRAAPRTSTPTAAAHHVTLGDLRRSLQLAKIVTTPPLGHEDAAVVLRSDAISHPEHEVREYEQDWPRWYHVMKPSGHVAAVYWQ